jgi:hypothetical protein
MPTRKGDIIAATDVAPKAVPISVGVNPSPFIQEPIETPQVPQTKNCAKNRIEIWMRAWGFMAMDLKTFRAEY